MTVFSQLGRDELKSLLEDHESVCNAIARLKTKGYKASMFVENENDSTENIVVNLDYSFADMALQAQKKEIDEKLAALDIKVTAK